MKSEIKLSARQIADSRGKPTVEVQLSYGSLQTRGDVPAGASKGEDEAKTVAVPEALRNITEVIAPLLQKLAPDLSKHAELWEADQQLVRAAGENFGTLGANAVLPVSRALWRMAAQVNGVELCAYIKKNAPDLASNDHVHFLMNIFNGGLHAIRPGETLGVDRIDIQEIMIVPFNRPSYADALAVGEKVDASLKSLLQTNYGRDAVTRADEAGFSVRGLGDSTVAISLVFDAIKNAGFAPGKDVKLALDVAASSFYDAQKKQYKFQGKFISSEEMIAYLVEFVDRYKGMVLSIEDGLAENDWAAWTVLSREMKKRGVLTVGDDLFVTQLPRLNKGIESQAAHAILIKVNQNGSISGTLDVMRRAKAAGMLCIVSHRSGETLDDSIADLAYATGSLGLKTGDPQPPIDFPDQQTWVRRNKYLRMVEIEKQTL